MSQEPVVAAEAAKPSRLRRLGAVAASLLFPGLGQVVNGRWLRGLGFAVATFVCFQGLLVTLASALGTLWGVLGAVVDPVAFERTVAALPVDRLLALLGWNFALMATLGLSVWDAWRGSRGRP